MKKKIFSVILTMTMILTMVSPVAAQTPPQVGQFVDVHTSDWFYEHVDYVVHNGLMNGYSDAVFAPGDEVNRAMLVTILFRLEGEPDGAVNSFPDVAPGQWYTRAVAWAAKNGIVKGYDDGTFKPGKEISREEMAVILFRYAEMKQYDTTARGYFHDFLDEGFISGWAVKESAWAVGAELMNGVPYEIDGYDYLCLEPYGNATRAQITAVLHRFCDRIVAGGKYHDTVQTDSEIEEIARSQAWDDFNMLYAWYEYDESDVFQDPEQEEILWAKVADKRVSNLTDLDNFWHIWMAKSYALPASVRDNFRVENGKLYLCLGGDEEYMYLYSVTCSDLLEWRGDHAEFSLDVVWYDDSGSTGVTVTETYLYELVKEDGRWKCANIQQSMG